MVPLAQETLGRRKGTRRLSVSADGLSGPSLSSPQPRGSQSARLHIRDLGTLTQELTAGGDLREEAGPHREPTPGRHMQDK